MESFKPYYKWNTFNTFTHSSFVFIETIGFKPYYKWNTFNTFIKSNKSSSVIPIVLNLIINGIPSILEKYEKKSSYYSSFKPYYKWNTFNTKK